MVKRKLIIATGLLALLATLQSQAEFTGYAASGTVLRDLFINEATVQGTGTHVDFNGIAGSKFTTLASAPGVTFQSNIQTNGVPFGPVHIVASTFSDRLGTIVGTPYNGGSDDGRVGYQILFSEPQQYAGIQRNWNDAATTAFYNSQNELLYEFSGLYGHYVGYTGNPSDPSTWVSRIQMDGGLMSGVRQVGYSDDLVYGISESFAVPEASTHILMGVGFVVVGLAAARRKR